MHPRRNNFSKFLKCLQPNRSLVIARTFTASNSGSQPMSPINHGTAKSMIKKYQSALLTATLH
ncbi:hypothetical protein TSUD_160690 [Trifolium subterraneum]|uniref:Uncharacterized protein n=1 Tax=Trifolium subterraneum TaxID=3900 RepID=A0A2Z6MBF9_TRISU|nr:hypothetical protein TSUD_160690 [Trifolium subterraneum]